MSKMNERCYICKWWDFDNQISIKLYNPTEDYNIIEEGALCKYIHPPKTHTQYKDGLYLLANDYCGAFKIAEQFEEKRGEK